MDNAFYTRGTGLRPLGLQGIRKGLSGGMGKACFASRSVLVCFFSFKFVCFFFL